MIMHKQYTTSITLQSMIIAAGSVPAADVVISVSTNQGNYLRDLYPLFTLTVSYAVTANISHF